MVNEFASMIGVTMVEDPSVGQTWFHVIANDHYFYLLLRELGATGCSIHFDVLRLADGAQRKLTLPRNQVGSIWRRLA